MNCDQYKKLRAKFSKLPLSKDVADSLECEEWGNHFHECQECSDWELNQRLLAQRIDSSSYPCVHVAYYAANFCDKHKDAWECSDIALGRLEDGTFGIPIRDGGNSMYSIKFCPWCGVSLK